MISVESSSKGCSETLFSTHLTQKRPKPKKKDLKVTTKKCSTLMCILHIHVLLSFIYLRHNIVVFTNKSLQKKWFKIYVFTEQTFPRTKLKNL